MGKLDRKKIRSEVRKEKEAQEEKDPFHDFEGTKSELALLKFSRFLGQNRKNFFIGAFAIIVGMIAFISIAEYNDYRNERATRAIEALEDKLQKDSGSTVDKKITAYQKLFTDYGSGQLQLRVGKVLADLYAEKGEYKKAAEQLEKVTTGINDLPEIKAYYFYLCGNFREKAGQKEKALTNFQSAAALVKTNREVPSFKAWSFFQSGRLKYELGKKKEALKDLQKSLEADSKMPDPSLYEVKKLATYLILKINRGS